MTVFVETDFLLAIAKDDWLQERSEDILDEREVVTSPFADLKLLIVLGRHQFDYGSSPTFSTSSRSEAKTSNRSY